MMKASLTIIFGLYVPVLRSMCKYTGVYLGLLFDIHTIHTKGYEVPVVVAITSQKRNNAILHCTVLMLIATV
jgi:hypothetical protein